MPEVVIVGGFSGLGALCAATLSRSGWRVTRTSSRVLASDGPTLDLCRPLPTSLLDSSLGRPDAIVVSGSPGLSAEQQAAADLGLGTGLSGLRDLTRWARKHDAHLVFLSSGSVYADDALHTIQETVKTGASLRGGAYAEWKLRAEQVLCDEQNLGLRVAILRLGAICGGTRKRPTFLYDCIRAARGEFQLPFRDDGDLVVRLLEEQDAAAASYQAIRHQAVGVFNVAGDRTTIRTARRVTLNALGASPSPVAGKAAPAPSSLPRLYDLDTSRFRSRTGWRPVVGLHQGITEWAAGIREQA